MILRGRPVGSEFASISKKCNQIMILFFAMMATIQSSPAPAWNSTLINKINTVDGNTIQLEIALPDPYGMTQNQIENITNSILSLERKFNASVENLQTLSNESNTRISFLNNVKHDFKNQPNGLNDKIENLEAYLKNLTENVRIIKEILPYFKNIILKEERETEKIRLSDEYIKEIEAHRFHNTEKKLSGIDDVSEISYIVRKAYNNHANNFNLLMKFGEVIQPVDQRFAFYKALYNELNNYGHFDFIKLLRLIRSLRENYSLFIDNGVISEEVNSLILMCEKSFTRLYLVQGDEEIDQKSVVEFAFGIKKLLNYESLYPKLKIVMNAIKDKLPKSVKNMAFSSEVCISYSKYKGYIYADQSQMSNVDGHKVNWEGSKNGSCKKEWTFEHTHDDVVCLNNHAVNETYYAGHGLRRNKLNGDDTKWMVVEPVGDNIRLKTFPGNQRIGAYHNPENLAIESEFDDIFEIGT